MASFSDHFSEGAAGYAAHRPRYPAALAQWLASVAPDRGVAWDCGTGNGQAAESLAHHFAYVVGTDASTAQLAQSPRRAGLGYAAMTAENAALRDSSVALITVAQALHWFDMSKFFTEAQRVLMGRGVLAVWTYGLISVDQAIDPHIARFYGGEVGPWWSPERALVDSGYRNIELPFVELEVPVIGMDARWRLTDLAAYLDTWSAVSKYVRAHGQSPVGQFISSIAHLWGPADTPRRVTWPLSIKACRKP